MVEPTQTQEPARTADQRFEAIEGVVIELIDRVEKLTKEYEGFKKQAVTKPKGLFGGKRTPSPTKDLKTGVVYASKAAVGKALAAEAGANPLDTMAYYTVLKVLKMPDGSDRFVNASEDEGKAAREEYQKTVQAEVDATNARLEAEEKAKAEAEAKAAKTAKPAPQQPQQPQQPKKK